MAGIKDFTKSVSFLTTTNSYTKVEQSERWMVWEVSDRNGNFECWEVWTPKDGQWRKPKMEDFGTTGFYCTRKQDVEFWKRNL